MDSNCTYNRYFIEKILPHRSPFLLVDSITSYKGGQYPSIRANYAITDKEPAYYNNLSGSHWPSIYIIEGMGQCCNLAIIISALEKGLMLAGLGIKSIDDVLQRLMFDESDDITNALKSNLHQRLTEIYLNIGFLGSADVKITGHVSYGQVVSYEVRQNQVYGSLYHSTVKAFSDDKLIAHGTMVSAARRE